MSEYQYYEFQALDRPLDADDRAALRAISSRARITATSFTNAYDWGNFKGNQITFMERWFDLHLYLANWGTREFMMRMPAALVDRRRLTALLKGNEEGELHAAGDHLILIVAREEVETDDWDDGTGWLAALAPLRGDLLAGDLRLIYLIWLMAVEIDAVAADVVEPLPGLGPLTGPLEAFAAFFQIDPDLVAAACESGIAATQQASRDAHQEKIAALPDEEKNALLAGLIDGDPHVAIRLRARLREGQGIAADADGAGARTAGRLRERAEQIGATRAQEAAREAAIERERREREAVAQQRIRLDALSELGDAAWRQVDDAIARRNQAGYDDAITVLRDLRVIAHEKRTLAAFARRIDQLRDEHAKKPRFIERLASLDTAY